MPTVERPKEQAIVAEFKNAHVQWRGWDIEDAIYSGPGFADPRLLFHNWSGASQAGAGWKEPPSMCSREKRVCGVSERRYTQHQEPLVVMLPSEARQGEEHDISSGGAGIKMRRRIKMRVCYVNW